MHSFKLIATGLLTSVALPAAAFAQQQPPRETAPAGSANADGEIIITALKEGRSVLKTAASVTVVSSEELASKNLVEANQLNGIVPGLVQSNGVFGLPGVTFRGLGSSSSVFGLEQSVAAYLDGVYLGHSRDYIMPMYDMDRVEMIRGTQSTLLGKNTSLGAVSFVTRRPDKDFGVELTTGYTTKIGRWRAEGAVNAPLSETVQARAAFVASDEDGWYRNDYTGRDEERLRQLSGRLSISAQLGDSSDATFIYQHDDRRGRGQLLEILSDPSNVLRNRAAAAGQTNLNVVPDDISSAGSDPLGGTVAGPEPYQDNYANRLNLIVNVGLGDHTLTSQTAFVDIDTRGSVDVDFIAANLFNLVDHEQSRTFSQELRLSSPTAQRFQYILGLYYYHNVWQYDRNYLGSPSNTVGFPLTGNAYGEFNGPTTAYSAYASTRFAILDQLRLVAGGRYTYEKKKGDFMRVGTGTLGATFPNIPFIQYASQISKPFDYNVGVEFEPTDGLLLYATYGKGSKSGGFQEYPTTPAGAIFTGETAKTIEAGGKYGFGPGNFLTLALFQTKVNDFQASFTQAVGTPPVIQTVVGNTDVRSRGFEANLGYRLSPDLEIGAAINYADATYQKNFPQVGAPVAIAGDRLIRAPEWTGNVKMDYQKEVGGGFSIVAGASVDFSSAANLQPPTFRPDAPRAASHQIVDARIALRNSGGWEVAVIGNNIFNDRYITFDTPVSASGAGIFKQGYYGTLNRPRVVTIQLKYKM